MRLRLSHASADGADRGWSNSSAIGCRHSGLRVSRRLLPDPSACSRQQHAEPLPCVQEGKGPKGPINKDGKGGGKGGGKKGPGRSQKNGYFTDERKFSGGGRSAPLLTLSAACPPATRPPAARRPPPPQLLSQFGVRAASETARLPPPTRDPLSCRLCVAGITAAQLWA